MYPSLILSLELLSGLGCFPTLRHGHCIMEAGSGMSGIIEKKLDYKNRATIKIEVSHDRVIAAVMIGEGWPQ